MGHATFEDKRRENFEKGQAELERRRQIILEQQRREQQERERKEREEMHRREKVGRNLFSKGSKLCPSCSLVSPAEQHIMGPHAHQHADFCEQSRQSCLGKHGS